MLKTILLLSLTPLATVAQSSPDVFAGNYSDPNHPKCPRTVIVENNAMGTVTGADAATKGDPCDGKTDKKWGPLKAIFDITGPTINVDFSSKGGPPQLTGTWNTTSLEIDWVDGNNWPSVKCSNKQYCCPDAKHCLLPRFRYDTHVPILCETNADCETGSHPTCCPLAKICVQVGVPCFSPCADQNSYCCPDALHCLTPITGKLCNGESSNCASGQVCCPITDLCVNVGDACVPR